MESPIISYKMRGHQGPVTCLDHSSSLASFPWSSTAACLLSGSEDGTARLWDLREHLRASLCIKTPSVFEGEIISSEIMSVSFASTFQSCPEEPDASAFARSFAVYVSAGSVVYEYDLRKASSPIITLKEADMLFCAEDDINQLSLSGSDGPRRTPSQIALADDAGHITVSEQGCIDSAVTLVHDEQSLVMSAVFRPNCYKTLQLASGGADCRVALWDSARPRKALDSFHVQSLSTNANQVCNPPMVNNLAWSPSGRLLAAALGDGSCALFMISENRSLVLTSRLEDAHSGPVASVVFPKWSLLATQSEPMAYRDRLLCSVGNDGKIALWDVGSSLGGDQAHNPSTLFPNGMSADDTNDLFGQPKTLFAWHHNEGKPNWLVSSCGLDSTFPSALFLADTSNDISIYSIPLA